MLILAKYQLGKIYKIVDNTNNNIYVGSTYEPTLSRRLSNHRSSYKSYLLGNADYVTAYDILANNDFNIVLIENYPCNNRDELLARERYFVDTLDCVNKVKPFVTAEETIARKKLHHEVNKEKYNKISKEYHEKHKEKQNEVSKQYHELNKDKHNQVSKDWKTNNKDRVKAYNAVKLLCGCGIEYCKASKSRHERTQRHLNFFKEL